MLICNAFNLGHRAPGSLIFHFHRRHKLSASISKKKVGCDLLFYDDGLYVEVKNAAVSFTCVDQSTLFSGTVILVSRTVVKQHNEAKITARKNFNEDFYISREI